MLAQAMPGLQAPPPGQLAPSIEVGSLPAQSSLNSLNVPGALSPSLSLPVGAVAMQGSTTPSVAPADSINTPGISVTLPSAGSMPGLLPSVSSSASVPGVGLLGDAQLSFPSIPPATSLQLPSALPAPAIGSLVRGTLFHVADGGTYGFVKPDGGGADVFAMPPLSGFPLAGSRVVCNLVFDQNLPGKMRAENIQLENNLAAVSQQVPVQPSLTGLDPLAGLGTASLASLPTAASGVLAQQQPQTLATHLPMDAAVLATAAPAINAQSLLASVTAAAETQALNALLSAADPTLQAVLTQQLLAGATLQSLQGLNAGTTASAAVNANGRQGGTMRHIQTDGKFGFIKPDHGGADVLALPPSAGFPTIGARVTFDVIADDKTGRPKADNLEVVNEIGTAAPLDLSALGVGGFGPALLAATNALRSAPFPTAAAQRQQGPVTQPGDNVLHGAISKVSAKFAFIRQDSGEADMFVIPPACEAFGRELPPVGTRVQYKVILDSKSGRPRADCVGPSLAPHLG